MSAPGTTGNPGRPFAASAGAAPSVAGEVAAAIGADAQLSAREHASSDVDGSPVALHHTLGPGDRQAAPGSHGHDGTYAPLVHTHTAAEVPDLPRSWLVNGTTPGLTTAQSAETADPNVPQLTFTAVSGRRYRIRYTGRPQGSAATVADLIVRGRSYTGSVPTVTTADTQLARGSAAMFAAGGGGAMTAHAIETLACPADIAAGEWVLRGFWDTTGAGTTQLGPNGERRQLEVTEHLA
jgi:hypothetical protein